MVRMQSVCETSHRVKFEGLRLCASELRWLIRWIQSLGFAIDLLRLSIDQWTCMLTETDVLLDEFLFLIIVNNTRLVRFRPESIMWRLVDILLMTIVL